MVKNGNKIKLKSFLSGFKKIVYSFIGFDNYDTECFSYDEIDVLKC